MVGSFCSSFLATRHRRRGEERRGEERRGEGGRRRRAGEAEGRRCIGALAPFQLLLARILDSRGRAGRLGGQEGGRSGGREGGWRGRLTLSSSKQNLQRASLSPRPCNTLRVRHRVKRIHAWLHRLCPLPRTEARTTAATPAAVAVAVAVAASPSLSGRGPGL